MHLLPGRVRVIAKPMKGNESIESMVHAKLHRLKGVRSIRTSIISGAITVRFDAEQISPYKILNMLIHLKLIPNVVPISCRKTDLIAPRRTNQDTDTKKLLLSLASAAMKLAIPILLDRYFGRSAARALRHIV